MNYESLNECFVEKKAYEYHYGSDLENLLRDIANDTAMPENYRLVAWQEYNKIEEKRKARRQAKIRKTESIINEVLNIIKNAPSGFSFCAAGLYEFLNESEDFHNCNQNPTKERKYYATRDMTKIAIKRALEKDILEEKTGCSPYHIHAKIFYVVK
jgi:uncharacterized protein (UPF0147 family)